MAQKILQYEIIERLGEGAGSVIYKVRDPKTKQEYALKHVPRKKPKDIRFVTQMEDEFKISKDFNHENLRKAIDFKVKKSLLFKITDAYMVMDYVDGVALDRRPVKTVLEVVDTFIQVAQGLKAMHQMGYIHCDLKPNNIIRDDQGKVKVIDFGQTAKAGTVKERIQGTPDYIAPEQYNRKPITFQTDVYNLGATLYFALLNKPIPTLYTVNKKGDNSFLMEGAIPTPAQVNPRIPVALSNLIMECVAVRPDKRPENMDVVISRLELTKHTMRRVPPAAGSPPPGAQAAKPPPSGAAKPAPSAAPRAPIQPKPPQ